MALNSNTWYSIQSFGSDYYLAANAPSGGSGAIVASSSGTTNSALWQLIGDGDSPYAVLRPRQYGNDYNGNSYCMISTGASAPTLQVCGGDSQDWGVLNFNGNNTADGYALSDNWPTVGNALYINPRSNALSMVKYASGNSSNDAYFQWAFQSVSAIDDQSWSTIAGLGSASTTSSSVSLTSSSVTTSSMTTTTTSATATVTTTPSSTTSRIVASSTTRPSTTTVVPSSTSGTTTSVSTNPSTSLPITTSSTRSETIVPISSSTTTTLLSSTRSPESSTTVAPTSSPSTSIIVSTNIVTVPPSTSDGVAVGPSTSTAYVTATATASMSHSPSSSTANVQSNSSPAMMGRSVAIGHLLALIVGIMGLVY